MTGRSKWAMVAGAAMIGAVAVAVWAAEKEAKEEKVSLDQVPAAVKATILKAAEGGAVKEVERESRDGKTVYEADVVKDGKEIELQVAEDGKLIAREDGDKEEKEEGDDEEDDEEAIAIDRIPAAARESLAKHANGAKITKVTREREDGAELFEAEWSVDGLARSVEVTADGEMVEMEQQVAAKDAPAAIQKAVKKMFPGAADVVIEKKVRVEYEVKATVRGKKKEVTLTPAGKPAENEGGDEDGEHEEKDGKDDK